MKIVNIRVKGIPPFKDEMNIDFYAASNVSETTKDQLHCMFHHGSLSIYSNHVLSFVGLNASGKTTVLKVIEGIICLLNGESIHKAFDHRILKQTPSFEYEVVLFDEEETLYKIYSKIIKYDDPYELKPRYVFKDEYIFKKKIKDVTLKKNLLLFDGIYFKERTQDIEYLKDDESICLSLTKHNRISSVTNTNELGVISNDCLTIIQYLDPRIEQFQLNQDRTYTLKFFDQEEIVVSNKKQLETYLSKGTIKGLTLFINAMHVFKTGGYLIVDDIECSLNKEIVCTLLRMFIDGSVNTKGATLVFSTHYVELIDELDRNDCMYVIRRETGVCVDKLSELIRCDDLKKSDLIISDYLGGTAPQYDLYIRLKRQMKQIGR